MEASLTDKIEEADLALGDALLPTVKQWGHGQPAAPLVVTLNEEL